MKKFITLFILVATIFLGANSIVAKTSQAKRAKATTTKSNKKPTRSSTPTVVQSQPIELDNGMTIVKYSLDMSKGRSFGFNYSIEWPVSGPEPLTKECRNFIASVVNNSDAKLKLNNGDVSISNFIESKYKSFLKDRKEEFPDNDGDILDYCNIFFKADSKKTIISANTDYYTTDASGVHGDGVSKMFLNNGKTLDYSMLPPIEVMKPIILKYICEFGDPADDPQEYDYLDYPYLPPVVVDGNLVFDYGFEGGMYITSSIPVFEIISLASSELLEFLQ